MKIFVITLSMFFSLSALAARTTLVCKDDSNNKWRLSYDSSLGKAAIYSMGETGKWHTEYTDARAIQAADGGPLVISGVDNTKVDWSKQKGCYVWAKPSIYITLRRQTGSLQMSAKIKTNPVAFCNVPSPVRPPPRNLNCK